MNIYSFWSKIMFLIINNEKGKDFTKIHFKRQIKDIVSSMLVVKNIVQRFIESETITQDIINQCMKHKYLKQIISNNDFLKIRNLEKNNELVVYNETYKYVNNSMLLIVEDIIKLCNSGRFKINQHKIKKLLYSLHNLPRIYVFEDEHYLDFSITKISIKQAIEYGKMSLSEEEKEHYFPYSKFT